GCMILNLALNLALIWRFGEAGMAAATSTAAIVQFLLLWRLARRDLCSAPLADPALRRSFLLIASASLAMLAVVWVTGRTLKPLVTVGWVGQLATLGAMSAAGVASYAAVAKLLGVRELSWLLSRAGDR
ncbi:MAG: polysaccharide biosynthesis C-terminal domain-containing protein, partial [Phycisphaerales bacterium]